MKRTFLAMLAAVTALALAGGGKALADNNATNSIGVAQIGSVGAAPTATAGDNPAAAATAPTAVDGTGGNTSTGSTGVVQAGGNNDATHSTGAVQAGGTSSAPVRVGLERKHEGVREGARERPERVELRATLDRNRPDRRRNGAARHRSCPGQRRRRIAVRLSALR